MHVVHLLCGKRIKIAHQIAHPNTGAIGLACVCRTDAFLCGAQRVAGISFLGFLQTIDCLMEIEHQMGTIGHNQTVLPAMQSFRFVLGQFLE